MAENGNRNGNGRNGNVPSAVSLATLISLAVLILGMIGFWWNQADPRQSLADIRHSVEDLRRLHTEDMASLIKTISTERVSLREHNDLQARINKEVENLEKKDESLLTKAQFEAWKNERDVLITDIRKDIDEIRHMAMPRAECEIRWVAQHKLNDDFQHRMDSLVEKSAAQEVWKNTQDRVTVLQAQLDKIREVSQTNPTDILNHRIDQLYQLYREMQQQQFELHGQLPQLKPQNNRP